MALIPLPPPPPRHPWRRLSQAIGVIIGLVILLLLFGEPLAELLDQQRHPVPGRLVKVDDQPIHLFVKGAHGSLPTVVIDGDLGLPALAWAQLVQELSQKTLVVAWDRPGYGWSPLGGEPHDGATLMEQLRKALLSREQLGPLFQGQEVSPPFLLVGQGLGAAHMRIFATAHPQDVIGMVLVDCLYPGPEADRMKTQQEQFTSEAWKRRFLVRRFSSVGLPDWIPDVPGDLRPGAEAMLGKVSMAKAEAAELSALDATLKQADQLRSFGDKPLRVLRTQSSGDPDLVRNLSMDRDLAGLSTHGDLQMIPSSPLTLPFGPTGQAAPLLQAIQLVLGVSD